MTKMSQTGAAMPTPVTQSHVSMGVCKSNDTTCCMALPGTVAASTLANLKNPSAGFHLQLTPRRIYEA
jgi:hypothetical protein